MSRPALTVGRRLTLGFLFVMLTTVVVAVVGAGRVAQIENHLTTVNDVNAVKQRYAINFRGSVHDRAIALRDVVLARDSAEAATEVERIEALAADYQDSAGPLAEIFADDALVNDEETAALGRIQDVEAQTEPLVQEVIALKRAGDDAAARALLADEVKPLFVSWLDAINVLIDLEEEMNAAETDQAREIASGFVVGMTVLVVLTGALAAAVAWWIVRSITRPLGHAVDVLAAVAGGDLTARMEVTARDEVGRMGQSLNSALGTIGEAMATVAARADGLSTISVRIGSLSEDIAAGAQSSATQADVVASAAEEVSANVQSVASGAQQMGASISEIAGHAGESARVAEDAVTAVGATTATVSRLGESSDAISDVVSTITSIAEQTNLLALNATIEAARAGEAGKGFAVVAGEVKDLAQETARATEDISRKVVAIQSDTREAVAAISAVEDVMRRLHEYQLSIATAVEEQTVTTNDMNRSLADSAAGSGRIAESIVGVAAVARSTTASVTDSQGAADDLAGLAAELQHLMARFRFAVTSPGPERGRDEVFLAVGAEAGPAPGAGAEALARRALPLADRAEVAQAVPEPLANDRVPQRV